MKKPRRKDEWGIYGVQLSMKPIFSKEEGKKLAEYIRQPGKQKLMLMAKKIKSLMVIGSYLGIGIVIFMVLGTILLLSKYGDIPTMLTANREAFILLSLVFAAGFITSFLLLMVGVLADLYRVVIYIAMIFESLFSSVKSNDIISDVSDRMLAKPESLLSNSPDVNKTPLFDIKRDEDDRGVLI